MSTTSNGYDLSVGDSYMSIVGRFAQMQHTRLLRKRSGCCVFLYQAMLEIEVEWKLDRVTITILGAAKCWDCIAGTGRKEVEEACAHAAWLLQDNAAANRSR